MVDKALKKFAKELKSIREKKAISLNEIHDKTRIDLKYLNDIEDGNFAALPEIYMRGFLKKYADFLELDQEEVLNNFDLAKDEGSGNERISESKKIELDKGDQKNDSTFDDFEEEKSISQDINNDEKKRNSFVILIFLIISVAVVILYFAFLNGDSEEIVIEKPIEEIISEKSDNIIENTVKNTQQNNDSQSSEILKDSLTLGIQAIETSWMRLMVDNEFKDEFILNPNISRTVKASSNFSLLIGNAGGIELTLNGKKLPQIGKKGQIKNISVDSSGIHYMRIKKN